MSVEKIFTNPAGERKIAAGIQQDGMMVEIMRSDKVTLAAIELTLHDAKQLASYLHELISNYELTHRF